MIVRSHAALLALALAPAAALAQPTVSLELAAANAYVWRGVTNANQPVAQPTLALELPVRGAALTLGAWGNLEPRRADGPHDIGTLGGQPGPLLTQSQLYAELAGARGALHVSGGATAYLYPHVGELASTYQTVELYAVVAREGTLAPSLSVWQDVGRVRGAYLEGGLGQEVPVGRGHVVALGAALGVSAGMREREGQASYFARDGVTHAELSATTELSRGAVAFAPTVHVVLASDPLARVAAADARRAAKLWAGMSVRWSRPLAHVAVRPPHVVHPVLLPPVYSDAGDVPDEAARER